MSIIAIANEKGGVGKTTTAVTLGALAAQNGYNTLLVDLDAQGHIAKALGMEPGDDVFELIKPGSRLVLEETAVPSGRENLSVLRSYRKFANAPQMIQSDPKALYNVLLPYSYDLIILDCAPGLDIVLLNALFAALYLIIPTELKFLSIDQLNAVITTLNSLRARTGQAAEFKAVLPTMYERTLKEQTAMLVDLAKQFNTLVYPPVPKDPRVDEAVREGKTIPEYAPSASSMRGVNISRNGKPNFIGGYAEVFRRVEKEMIHHGK